MPALFELFIRLVRHRFAPFVRRLFARHFDGEVAEPAVFLRAVPMLDKSAAALFRVTPGAPFLLRHGIVPPIDFLHSYPSVLFRILF